MKKVYFYDENGIFTEEAPADIDPRATAAAGVEMYLLPVNATFDEPPAEIMGFNRVWDGQNWEYEEIPDEEPEQQPEPTEIELKQYKINELKSNLYVTDYVVIKIAEGVATKEEYAEVIANRAEWRAEINQLEVEICELQKQSEQPLPDTSAGEQ